MTSSHSHHAPPVLRTLMNTIAADDDNIPEHLTKLKHCWDQLCLSGDTNYRVSEFLFKRIIASSLPESWDQFTDLVNSTSSIPIPGSISTLSNLSAYSSKSMSGGNPASLEQSNSPSKSYTLRLAGATTPDLHSLAGSNQDPSSSMYCKICERTNHITMHHR
jgi:hypothetical protein